MKRFTHWAESRTGAPERAAKRYSKRIKIGLHFGITLFHQSFASRGSLIRIYYLNTLIRKGYLVYSVFRVLKIA